MRDVTISEIRRGYLNDLASQHKRVDGRDLEEFRPITAQANYIGTAEGSAKVTIGNSEVLSGVKLGLATPYPDSPNVGVMTTNFELRPVAAHHFETGPPRPPQIELSRVVDRGIRESRTIDLKQLCITEGEKVWMVFIDGLILNHGGNLFDALTMAAMTALKSANVPAAAKGVGEDFKLPTRLWPVSVTSWKLGDIVLVDPTLEEELVADARLTVTVDENGDLRAMQKGGTGAFSRTEVEEAYDRAVRLAPQIRKQLEAAL